MFHRMIELIAIKSKLVFSIYFFPEILLTRISDVTISNKINKIHSFFLISSDFTDSISDSDTKFFLLTNSFNSSNSE